jgi:hypothetical protein
LQIERTVGEQSDLLELRVVGDLEMWVEPHHQFGEDLLRVRSSEPLCIELVEVLGTGLCIQERGRSLEHHQGKE